LVDKSSSFWNIGGRQRRAHVILVFTGVPVELVGDTSHQEGVFSERSA
jgi:hypothetical protein